MRAMTTKLTLLALVAAVLAGCESETITSNTEDNQLANAVANVQLPPSNVASHKYRCGDNSVVSIDWLSDGKVNSARATPDGGAGINLAQAEAGGDYTAEGTPLKGEPQATSVTFNGKSCKR